MKILCACFLIFLISLSVKISRDNYHRGYEAAWQEMEDNTIDYWQKRILKGGYANG